MLARRFARLVPLLAIIGVIATALTACHGAHVLSVTPHDGATGAAVSTSVTAQLSEPVDYRTIGSGSVKLLDPAGRQVAGNYNSDGAGSLVTFTPAEPLALSTAYTFRVTTALRTASGGYYDDFTSRFTTSAVPDPDALPFGRTKVADVAGPTTVVWGPDAKLYVATLDGRIVRYTVGPDNQRTSTETLVSLPGRTILGLRFDPSATPANLRLWITNNAAGDASYGPAPAQFSGRISVLSGATLATRRDVIVGLPRSLHDHMTNGLDFGPDGRLYVTQGSMTGYGDVDSYWGNRPETPLSGAILVADVNRDRRFAGTVDVTTAAPVSYDPFATDAPVKVHARGLRNAYALKWHSNGKLYVPVNGAANGNSPGSPDGKVPALTNLPSSHDFVARVDAGRYYGHPNPSRQEHAVNGGNPTSGPDPWEMNRYPVGVKPQTTWSRPAWDLGDHRSPNGISQYRSSAFGGVLQGRLLISEYSQGDDIVALTLGSDGSIVGRRVAAAGFLNPLGISTSNDGRIAVTEFGNQPDGSAGRVTILVP